MDLTEIGLRRICGDTGPVLHLGAHVCIAGHTEAGDQLDLADGRFGEAVIGRTVNGDDVG